MCFGSFVVPWKKHARNSRDIVRHAFDVAYRMGDFTYAAYSFTQLLMNYLVVGDPLAKAQAEAERGVAFAKSVRLGIVADIVGSDLQLIRSLRGLTHKFGSLNDSEFDEAEFERHLASNPALADPGFGYWTLKAQARFLAHDYVSAVDASLRAQQLLWAAPTLLEQAAFRFYGALSHAAAWDSASPEDRHKHFEALAAHHKQLEIWADHCPENFENRAALVRCEDRTNRRAPGSMPKAFMKRPSARRTQTDLFTMRRLLTRLLPASTRHVVSKSSQTHTCSKPGIAISVGGLMAK